MRRVLMCLLLVVPLAGCQVGAGVQFGWCQPHHQFTPCPEPTYQPLLPESVPEREIPDSGWRSVEPQGQTLPFDSTRSSEELPVPPNKAGGEQLQLNGPQETLAPPLIELGNPVPIDSTFPSSSPVPREDQRNGSEQRQPVPKERIRWGRDKVA